MLQFITNALKSIGTTPVRRKSARRTFESQTLEYRRLLSAAGAPDVGYGNNGLQSILPDGHSRFPEPHGDIVVLPGGDIAGVTEFMKGSQNVSFAFLRDVNGSPKPGFGTAGFANLDSMGFAYTPESIAVQPDGKILIGGSSGSQHFGTGTVSTTGNFAIMRLNANGTLDTTFGAGGVRVIDVDRNDFGLKSLYVRPNGRILAAGTSQLFTTERYIALMQLNANGDIDTTFGDVPKKGFNLAGFNDNAEQLVFDTAHNRILVASTKTLVGRNDTEFAVHQFFENGIEDLLFGGGDAVVSFGDTSVDEVTESITLSGGWIYVAGYRYSFSNPLSPFSEDVVARVSRGPGHTVVRAGVWDDEFGGADGFLQVSQIGLSLLDAPNSGFYLAGETGRWGDQNPQWAFGISRYDVHANLVTSFGTNGIGRRLSSGPTTSGMKSRLQRDASGHLVFARDVDEIERYQLQIARFHEFGNVAPVVQLGAAVSYTEGALPTILSSGAVVTDGDSADFSGGNVLVTISANAQTGDVLSIRNQGTAAGQINTSGSGIFFGSIRIGTFSTTSGGTSLSIKLNASATPGRIRVLIRNLQFSSVSDDPKALRRTIRITVNDGDGGTSSPVLKFVNVTPVNDAPNITGFGVSVTYTRLNPPTKILSGATILSDPDSPNFSGGVLTAAITLNGQSTDVLTIVAGGTGNSAVTLTGTQVRVGEIAIGTFSGGKNNVALSITLNSSASRDRVQTLLRAIGFQNSSATASTLKRRVRFTLSDGDGLQTALTKLVNIV